MKQLGPLGKKVDPILHGAAGLIVKSEGGDAPKVVGGGAGDSILSRQENEADMEKLRLMSEQRARSRAARRGGYRALLSQERLSPESGLQTTLGAA